MVERLFLAVPWGCLRFVIVVFLDHTNLLFLITSHVAVHFTAILYTTVNSMKGFKLFSPVACAEIL